MRLALGIEMISRPGLNGTLRLFQIIEKCARLFEHPIGMVLRGVSVPEISSLIQQDLSDVRRLIETYLRLFAATGAAAQFNELLGRSTELQTKIGARQTLESLRGCVGTFLKRTFAYLFNSWVKFVYLPLAWEFHPIVWNYLIRETLMSVHDSDPRLWRRYFSRFFLLGRYFLLPTRPGELEESLNLAIAGAEECSKKRRRKSDPTAGPDPFAALVVPKLAYLASRAAQLEMGHQASDAIDHFLENLKILYAGPLPVLWRSANFTLEDSLSSFIADATTFTVTQINDRFPHEPPTEGPAATGTVDCRSLKGWMREVYEGRLRDFADATRTELRRIYRAKYPEIPRGGEFEIRCRRDREELRAAAKAAVEAAVQDAEDAARPEKEALLAEIEALQVEGAEDERSAALTRTTEEELAALVSLERENRQQFRKLHSLVLRMTAHIARESRGLAVLSKKIAREGKKPFDRKALTARLGAGEPLDEICREIEGEWDGLLHYGG
jgi:hypothetical protein